MGQHVGKVVAECMGGATAKLRIDAPGNHSRDQVACPGTVQLVSPHHPQETDESSDARVLEVFEDELLRGRVEVLEVFSSFGKLFEKRSLLLYRQGGRISLSENDVINHGLPAGPDILEYGCVFFGKPLDRCHCTVNVGKPSEVALVQKMVHHAGIRLVIVDPHLLQFKIFEPRKYRQATVEDRVDVVPEAGVVSILVGIQTSADLHVFFNDEDFIAGLP